MDKTLRLWGRFSNPLVLSYIYLVKDKVWRPAELNNTGQAARLINSERPLHYNMCSILYMAAELKAALCARLRAVLRGAGPQGGLAAARQAPFCIEGLLLCNDAFSSHMDAYSERKRRALW